MEREEVLGIIEKAKSQEWTELDLRNKGIDELPPEIGQLTALKGLYLDNNGLTALPPEIGQLTALDGLSLSGNGLTALPPEFINLTQLSRLELTGNPLESPPLEICKQGIKAIRQYFEEMKGQEQTLSERLQDAGYIANILENGDIVVRDQVLKCEFTYDIRSHSALFRAIEREILFRPVQPGEPTPMLNAFRESELSVKELRAHQRITGIMNDWFKEKDQRKALLDIIERAKREKWTELDLSGKDIVELPPEIGKLTVLKGLWLNDNQLKQLPQEIGQLTALEELWLNNNQLKQLPQEIGQLTALKELYLCKNQLCMLPREIGQLNCLKVLYLIENRIGILPSEVGQLINLKELWLGVNSLITLPRELINLTQLETLRLEGNNNLESPPMEICEKGIEAIRAWFKDSAKDGGATSS